MVKRTIKPVQEDFDGAWKIYFRDNLKYFLQFADIDAYNEIDWTRSPEFLDTELRRISRGFKKNKVVVDSRSISCLTFDDLYQFLEARLEFYPTASKGSHPPP